METTRVARGWRWSFWIAAVLAVAWAYAPARGEDLGEAELYSISMAVCEPEEINCTACSFVANLMTSARVHYCTGALAAPNAVIAPASCVDGRCGDSNRTRLPYVSLNTHRFHPDDDEERAKVLRTSAVIVHPGFNKSGGDACANDLAILMLEASAEIDRAVMSDGSCGSMYAAGWFKNGLEHEPGKWPNWLQRTKEEVEPTECKGNFPEEHISAGMLCAKTRQRTVCEWDRGALLMCATEHGEQLRGLATYSKRECNLHAPYGYMDVIYYKDWIFREIEAYGKRKIGFVKNVGDGRQIRGERREVCYFQ